MRLKEDSYSWKSRGIQRRMYRQAPLTPDEEAPRHKGKKKPKHVHDWQPRNVGRRVIRRTFMKSDGTYDHYEYDTPKTIYVCSRCGNKRGHAW